MARSFSASVDTWVMKSERRLEAIVKESAQRVGMEIKERTPVDTGFLRASLLASTSAMPIIDRDARPAGAPVADDATQIALVIAGASLGETIYFGFVAAYARHVEYGVNGRVGAGMVRLSAQRWPSIVREVVGEAKARFP